MQRIIQAFLALILSFSAQAQVPDNYNTIEHVRELYENEFQKISECNPDFLKLENLEKIYFPITCVGKKLSFVSISQKGNFPANLNEDKLKSFIRMRAKNDLGFLEQESITSEEAFLEVTSFYNNYARGHLEDIGMDFPYTQESLSKLGIHCEILTGGNPSTVIYTVNCILYPFTHRDRVRVNKTNKNRIEDNFVGSTNANGLDNAIMEAIEMSIKNIAIYWVEYDNARRSRS